MKIRILILGLILLLIPLSGIEKSGVINYDWQELFPDHLERVYIIIKNGAIIQHSSQYEAMINISVGMLETRLEERGSSIKEIVIIIHNHRKEKSFSRNDYKQYWTLKSYGFDGLFLLYCHRTKEVCDIESGEKLK